MLLGLTESSGEQSLTKAILATGLQVVGLSLLW